MSEARKGSQLWQQQVWGPIKYYHWKTEDRVRLRGVMYVVGMRDSDTYRTRNYKS